MKKCLTDHCEGLEFYKDKSRPDKLTKYCRDCCRQRSSGVKTVQQVFRPRKAKPSPMTPQEKIISAIKAGKRTHVEIAQETRIQTEKLDAHLAELTLDHVLRSKPFGEYQRIFELR